MSDDLDHLFSPLEWHVAATMPIGDRAWRTMAPPLASHWEPTAPGLAVLE